MTGVVALERSSGGSRLTASVDLRGGGLRELTAGGDALVETYPEGSPPPYCAGAVLFPWPNRVRDARWRQRGVEHHLPVDEPELGHANHGLVRAADFTVLGGDDAHVTVATSVAPAPGYPFSVDLRLTYRLTDDGLSVAAVVSNAAPWPAPVALGAHPYLRIADVPTQDLRIQVPADLYLPLDDRLIPGPPTPVAGTRFDLRAGRRLGDEDLNVCLTTSAEARAGTLCTVTAPDGRTLQLWADDDFPYLQVYACPAYPVAGSDGDPELAGSRRGLAVEPMTAPGDALNSGAGLRWLDPGAQWELAWGLRATWLTPGT